MAKQEFLSNLRIARSLFAHPRVATDDPGLDPRTIEGMVARAAIWLTPRSVRGFDVDDFPELGPQRQSELNEAVRAFREVAGRVPPTEPADPGQLQEASGAFQKILEILAPYLPVPPEGERVEKAMESVRFPQWVTNWDYELGSDEEGQPAVWVNLFADDSTAPRAEFGRLASRLSFDIRSALGALRVDRWPYVRLRTAVEHRSA